ncbi:hypothetical protein [Amycolatopsis sp. GM8]|uniref:hypothetical protein n=1 Tax=Amycolatopsis sp. GM8 TaxID=2896530 RepID=UPI001F4114E1|nr:hypothetical protein [Amycolatopsis sp. GM8]
MTAVPTAVALVVSGMAQPAWASVSSQPTQPTPQQRSSTAAGAPHSAAPATAATKGGAAQVTPAGAAPQASTQTHL